LFGGAGGDFFFIEYRRVPQIVKAESGPAISDRDLLLHPARRRAIKNRREE
jgi:hypothetical protein